MNNAHHASARLRRPAGLIPEDVDLHGVVCRIVLEAMSGTADPLIVADRRCLVRDGYGARPNGTGRACYVHWLAGAGLPSERVDRENLEPEGSQWVPEWLADEQAAGHAKRGT